MSLPPHLSFLRLGSVSAPHTLELWLDFVCPFSAKMWKNALEPIIKPAVETGNIKDKVQVLIRLQVQPWHGSSLFTHEAALAVGLVAPESFWAFATLLMEHQEDYFDRAVADQTPTQIRENLVKLAGKAGVESSKLPAIKDKLTYKTSPNGGVDVTNDVKWFIKVARQNGMHVSPQAVWDGVKNDSVGSSWGGDEWGKFWGDNVVA